MANLAATAVVQNDYFYPHRNQVRQVKNLTLTLTGQGTTTNKILASVLGFNIIRQASPAVKDDNTLVIVAAPSIDGSMLLLKAAGSNAPADYTAVVTLDVEGEV